MKKIVVIVVLGVVGFSCSYAMEQLDYGSTNTYAGVEITPQNICALLAQEARLDKAVRSAVKAFIVHHNLQELLSGASHQKILFTGDITARRKLVDEINEFVASRGLVNLSVNSIVLAVNDAWVIKKSRTHIARQNVIDTLESMRAGNHTHGAWMRTLTDDEWELFQTELGGKIYQNISRAMVYLRAREAVRRLGVQNIVIPETHLVHIPGRPKAVEDNNYVIIERCFHNRTPWDESPIAVDRNTVMSMVRLIAYTGWWTMGSAGSVVDGHLCYHDHELPNRHDIRAVFHRDVTHFRSLVGSGWGQLEQEIMLPYAQKSGIGIGQLLADKRTLQDEIQKSWLT